MVVKVYISGISGNKEVKKRQQRVLMILDSKNIKYDVIDITEPGKESDKDFMQSNATSNGGTVSDPNPRSALPPQLFNDDDYCGDYDLFDLANEMDTLEQFLKVEVPPEEPAVAENGTALNGTASGNQSKETSQERDVGKSSKEGTPAKEGTSTKSKEGTPAREGTPKSKEGTPKSKEGTPKSKEGTPAREGTPKSKAASASRDATPAKEGSPATETTSKSKEGTPARESTPAKESSIEKESATKENSPAREPSAEKAKSVETEVESKKSSKEGTPAGDDVNENGADSSREQSVEKAESVIERKKDNTSEALIASEQAAAE